MVLGHANCVGAGVPSPRANLHGVYQSQSKVIAVGTQDSETVRWSDLGCPVEPNDGIEYITGEGIREIVRVSQQNIDEAERLKGLGHTDPLFRLERLPDRQRYCGIATACLLHVAPEEQ